MANFVLVHGAFHGGWCWDDFAHSLREQGHTVLNPDLPGAGDDTTPLDKVTLETATQTIITQLKTLNSPAILVGHSMGGVVITQVAATEPTLVARLVYVTAFRPVDGESLLDLTGRPEGQGDGVQDNITVTQNPMLATFDNTKTRDIFYHDAAPEIAQAATPRLKPQPLSLFSTPVKMDATILLPQEYVICRQDRAVPPALQEFMARRSPAMVHEIDAGHSPFYSKKAELLDLFEEISQTVS